MDRLETRELAYFVAVAEELHFGRAAARLGIAQPPLSRAIKQLERRLGVQLLERGSRHATLTAAGEVLLHDGRHALDAVAAAAARARRAGALGPRLVLVMRPGTDGGLLPGILSAYERLPGAVAVDVRTCAVGEQAPMLRHGDADVAILHGHHPDLTGVDTEQLLVEPPVLIAWPAERRSKALAAFVHTATALAGEHRTATALAGEQRTATACQFTGSGLIHRDHSACGA
jgi:DNA-binding transcriptional LysR family regulator